MQEKFLSFPWNFTIQDIDYIYNSKTENYPERANKMICLQIIQVNDTDCYLGKMPQNTTEH